MTPLNIYLEHATDEEIKDAMDEYGNCIKQLAAANISLICHSLGVTRRSSGFL